MSPSIAAHFYRPVRCHEFLTFSLPLFTIDTDRIVCGRVCVMLWCLSISLSVPLFDRCSNMRQICCWVPFGLSNHLAAAHCCGGFAALGLLGSRYRSTAVAARHLAASASSAMLSATIEGRRETCLVQFVTLTVLFSDILISLFFSRLILYLIVFKLFNI